ncbi:MAG: protease pro-enzyme activation domain-containing protein [Candidatus Lutacidiplasmatales archaeon]
MSSVASDRLSLRVSSTVGAVEKAFHVGISRYRLKTGSFAFANSSALEIPASILSSVQGVVGERAHRVRGTGRATARPLGRRWRRSAWTQNGIEIGSLGRDQVGLGRVDQVDPEVRQKRDPMREGESRGPEQRGRAERAPHRAKCLNEWLSV